MYYVGIVEDRVNDPLKLGRCRVRVLSLHSPDKTELPTEDLPWATIMQPVTSAATSGIGQSPTGLVEGACVIVIFRDEHQQQPIIIGSVAGIPTKENDRTVQVTETSESAVWTTADGSIIKDSSGNPVRSGKPEAGKLSPKNPQIKKPTSALKPSEDCFNSIREEESFSSTVEGQNKYIKFDKFKQLSDNATVYPYQDIKGIWTIGWGSTYLKDGKSVPVTENTRLTKLEADVVMKDAVNNYFGPAVQKQLRAPVTQSMFDALVSMAYNVGVSGMTSSALFAAVNAANYEEAAGLINVFKTTGGVLTARRSREKKLFSKDGFPSKDMSTVNPPPEDAEPAAPDATQNPVVSPYPDGEQPGATAPGQNDKTSDRKVTGFKDPNGVYPKIFDEPDTHRLARHEKIDQTIVFNKESARAKGVLSGGKGKWSQPKVPYNAKYPFNHVYVSESGHVQEFDDTKDNERIHTYHRSGTYEEVDANGTRTNRIVGDDYEILERNGHVLIRGSLNVTIIGNQNIRVENDANIDVLGNVNLTVGGDYNCGVSGDFNVDAAGAVRIKAGNGASVDGSRVDLNGGKGKTLQKGKGSGQGVPAFPVLSTPNRNDEKIGQYEVPGEGDPTDYNKSLEASGVTDSSEDETPNNSSGEDEPAKDEPVKDEEPKKKPVPKVTDCSMIPDTGPIETSLRLSPNFTLGMLNGDRLASKPAVSLKKSEIACNLKKLAENCLEPIKKKYPKLIVTSGYRNTIPAGGSLTSDHLYGCAVDIQIGGFSRAQHYEAVLEIVKILPAWTQVIYESRGGSTWIHVAYNETRGLRMEKFTMVNDKRVSPSLFEIVSIA
jgi:GH24 family phage-related lysozyme (muramidase)